MALYSARHILMQLLPSGLHFYTFILANALPLPFFFHHIFPIFTLLSLPFSALQAVWYSPCVCRPAGSDPQLLQRERWKDPELLQHRGALPPVCQQCQTGGCWPFSHAYLHSFTLLWWTLSTQLKQNVLNIDNHSFSFLLQSLNASMRRMDRSVSFSSWWQL